MKTKKEKEILNKRKQKQMHTTQDWKQRTYAIGRTQNDQLCMSILNEFQLQCFHIKETSNNSYVNNLEQNFHIFYTIFYKQC